MIDFLPVPRYYNVFGFTLPTWMTTFAIAFITFIVLYFKLLEKSKLDIKHGISVFAHFGFWTIIGSHLYRVLIVKQNIGLLFSFKSGVDTFGFVGGYIAVFLYLRKHKLKIGKYFDLLSIPAITFLTLVRVGCALIADELGSPTTLAWGIYYKEALRHPVGLYYLLSGLAILLIIIYLKNLRNKLKDGNLFLIMLILYSISRVLLDFFRMVPPHEYFGLSVHQVAYGLLLVISLILLKRNSQNKL